MNLSAQPDPASTATTLVSTSGASVAATPVHKRRILRKNGPIFWTLYLSYFTAVVVFGYRFVLWYSYSIAPTNFQNTIEAYPYYYGELTSRGLLEHSPDGKTFHVLLLGGSTAEQLGVELENQLRSLSRGPVRVWNAARSAHTTRDTFNKMEYLSQHSHQYDLLIVYDGINDVQMNCIRDDLFRDDYSHCAWYRGFEKRRIQKTMDLQTVFAERMETLIGLGTPVGDNLKYGKSIKTGAAFRANLSQTINYASEVETPVLLMTFATHIPSGYTKEAFKKKQLDYQSGNFGMAVECWGTPEVVQRTMALHNSIIRELSATHSPNLLIDIERLMTSGQDFCDVCHLTSTGVKHFVEHIVAHLKMSAFDFRPRLDRIRINR